MRERIIKLLDFPRMLVRSDIDLERCSHAGNFAPGDPVCADCASRMECSWLYHNDDFSGLKQRRLAYLVQALEFALIYVEALSFRAAHRPKRSCPCDLCVWLNSARKLREEVGRSA